MSRFDWNGTVSSINWKETSLTGHEKPSTEQDPAACGYGLHNEFGMHEPVGFSDCPIGGWYPKIGVGLLKKDGPEHDFYSPHEIQPAEFDLREEKEHLLFTCRQSDIRGYSYRYEKKISLDGDGFTISYSLGNRGRKDIITDEYVHNFIAIAGEDTSPDLEISFPFQVDTNLFIENVNPENKLSWDNHTLRYKGTPDQQYFFSNITGGNIHRATWTIASRKHGISLTETANFDTYKINLWGWRHVVSPELFRKINLRPGESTTWNRTYTIKDL